ncbi:hypothetical protein Tco_0709674 [Tanacetum coccineum]
MSSTSYQSKPSQHFSSVNRFALDNEFELLFEYHPGQGTVGPFVPVQDDSPSEEVAPVKRKITKRHQQSKKTENHSNEPWSPQEEIALWKRIFRKGRKTKPKTTKLSTEWKCVKRRSQIKAKKSTKSKSQQKSQTVKVKVNPDKVKSTPRSWIRKEYNLRD